jgi:multicomponent Na+:H+ antiporter subunit C
MRRVFSSGDFGTCTSSVRNGSRFDVQKMMILKALIILTILIGLLGVLLKRNLLLKILAMDIMGTGIISLFVLASSRSGMRSPIAMLTSSDSYADPVPQAVILTAIVIGFSILALLLVCATALSRRFPTMDAEKIERRQDS